MWQREYLRCCAEQCQWDTVDEYSEAVGNLPLRADCLWRLQEWNRLRTDVLPKLMARPSELPSLRAPSSRPRFHAV